MSLHDKFFIPRHYNVVFLLFQLAGEGLIGAKEIKSRILKVLEVNYWPT